MSTPAAAVDVDSEAQQQAAAAGPTRRRITTPQMGEGERRRMVDVQIGGYEYTARCPKLVVWTDMATIIAEQGGRNRSDRRRAGDTARAADGRVTTDRIKLTQAMSLFLRGCLTSADWQAIEVDLSDPDDDLDLPDLWAAGVQLVVEFKPDMTEMADRIGIKVPGVLDKLADRIDPDTGELKPDTAAPAAAGKPAPRKSRARGRAQG